MPAIGHTVHHHHHHHHHHHLAREHTSMMIRAAVVAVAMAALLPTVPASAAPEDTGTDDTSVVRQDASGDVWVLMPMCEYEDGRTDGRVCMWVDADTGDGYVVTSDNYRQDGE